MKTNLIIGLCLIAGAAFGSPIKVEMRKEANGWQMYRGGEPYYIRGAGGHVHLDVVVECGGNSIRTWGLENAQSVLDEAHKRGLTVMLGMWMAHERHGFNYSDEWAVEDQFQYFKQAVMQFKDHPALLMWGVGNEVDLFYTDINVWDATERIAAMIHELDPNHPTCAVTAGIDVAEVQLINERAPSIDILGVNTYGAIGNLKDESQLYGWNKAYVVTEWGPTGHWEVPKTTWGASIEQTSTEKAVSYEERYRSGVLGDPVQCIGSYVFLWGQKQETTPTWYGVFLENGQQTGALDALHRVWKGTEPKNHAPVLSRFLLNSTTSYPGLRLSSGESVEVSYTVSDPDGDNLTIEWEVLPESTDIRAGGDKEQRPESLSGLVTEESEGFMRFQAPSVVGGYRLFIYATDGRGKVATANFPFYVAD
ncbi:MAG: hypothetical protein RL226_1012 [Bacteroidota bacterium]